MIIKNNKKCNITINDKKISSKSAKELFEELGYELDKEPRFKSVISYTKYCHDGCCRLYDLVFYESKIIDFQEDYLTYDLLQAINKQVDELNWNEK